MKPNSNLAAALRDEGYHTLNKFWKNAGNHLKPGGRIRLVFSDVGDMKLLHELAQCAGFIGGAVATAKYAASVMIDIYEFTKR